MTVRALTEFTCDECKKIVVIGKFSAGCKADREWYSLGSEGNHRNFCATECLVKFVVRLHVDKKGYEKEVELGLIPDGGPYDASKSMGAKEDAETKRSE